MYLIKVNNLKLLVTTNFLMILKFNKKIILSYNQIFLLNKKMIIDNDTQKFIDLILENKIPKIHTLTPKELRDMRAKMASIPDEHIVEIKSIQDISFVSK